MFSLSVNNQVIEAKGCVYGQVCEAVVHFSILFSQYSPGDLC